MSDFAFPQDEGIGTHSVGSGDKNDAANFGAVYDAIGLTDFVKTGMNFTVDYATPAVDISAGKAVLTVDSATATQENETRDEGVAFTVETDARTDLSLTDAAVNHVFLDISLTSDDAPSFHIDSDDTPPSQPYLKIGTIDTSNDTATELNRDAKVPPLSTDEVSGIPTVEPGDDLQVVVNNNARVRVSGELQQDVTVPPNTLVYGFGHYEVSNDTIFGDGIRGTVTLDESGPDCQIWGLAVANTTAGGDAVVVKGNTPSAERCSIFAKGRGIHLPSSSAGSQVEPKIRHNVIQSDTGAGSGSKGINNQAYTDAEIHHNIVKGFDTSIESQPTAAFITNNHTYKYPASSTGKAVVIGGGYTEVSHNYLEGDASVGIEATNNSGHTFENNHIVVADGAPGIHFNLGTSSNLNQCSVTGNIIESTGTGDVGVKGMNISGIWQTQIENNRFSSMNGWGLLTTNSGQATPTGDGTKTQFSIAHGLIETPDKFSVKPMNANSAAKHWYSKDATNMTVVFDTAPVDGAPLNFVWNAGVY